MGKLVEHDKRLAVMVADAVMGAVGGIGTNERHGIGDVGKQPSVSPVGNMTVGGTETQQGDSVEEIGAEQGLPDEALFYLSNL